MNLEIHCICEKKGIHKHVSWGGQPHIHFNAEVKVSLHRECNALHWYCMTIGCDCQYLKGVPR